MVCAHLANTCFAFCVRALQSHEICHCRRSLFGVGRLIGKGGHVMLRKSAFVLVLLPAVAFAQPKPPYSFTGTTLNNSEQKGSSSCGVNGSTSTWAGAIPTGKANPAYVTLGGGSVYFSYNNGSDASSYDEIFGLTTLTFSSATEGKLSAYGSRETCTAEGCTTTNNTKITLSFKQYSATWTAKGKKLEISLTMTDAGYDCPLELKGIYQDTYF